MVAVDRGSITSSAALSISGLERARASIVFQLSLIVLCCSSRAIRLEPRYAKRARAVELITAAVERRICAMSDAFILPPLFLFRWYGNHRDLPSFPARSL